MAEIIAEAMGGRKTVEDFKNSDEFKEANEEIDRLQIEEGLTEKAAIVEVAMDRAGRDQYHETGTKEYSGFAQIGAVAAAALLGQNVGTARLTGRNAAENNHGDTLTRGYAKALRESRAEANADPEGYARRMGTVAAGALAVGAAMPAIATFGPPVVGAVEGAIMSGSLGAYSLGMKGAAAIQSGIVATQGAILTGSVMGYTAGQNSLNYVGSQLQRGQDIVTRFGEAAYARIEPVLYRNPNLTDKIATEGIDFFDSFSGAWGGPTSDTPSLNTGAVLGKVSGKFSAGLWDIFTHEPESVYRGPVKPLPFEPKWEPLNIINKEVFDGPVIYNNHALP